jgi:hypothetical protein
MFKNTVGLTRYVVPQQYILYYKLKRKKKKVAFPINNSAASRVMNKNIKKYENNSHYGS